ncbi:hypothetical protein [uncultured Allobaculum sp.]|uniref:hypothetical protein n=1 Tax=uncultured Allobaculum sp. TaxID=1187017 RepID=UPI00258A49E8|nr:hypothetical protein [uncultured Allobaculum sp.]
MKHKARLSYAKIEKRYLNTNRISPEGNGKGNSGREKDGQNGFLKNDRSWNLALFILESNKESLMKMKGILSQRFFPYLFLTKATLFSL